MPKFQPKVNLDDIVRTFQQSDAAELAEACGIEYKTPRQIMEVAVRMSVEMRRKKEKTASVRIADAKMIPQIRKLLLQDLDRLGSEHRLTSIVYEDKNNDLVFKYIAIRR